MTDRIEELIKMVPTKRPVRIEGKIAYVPLTRGYESVIDADDVHLVKTADWFAAVDGRTVYAVRNIRLSNGKQGRLILHRVILAAPDGVQVDHIDGDGMNNRRSNLRFVTGSQNACNQRMSCDNTSGFKGVYWHKASQKWRAQIQMNGRRKHLGYFDTPETAYATYTEASILYHGEFGRLA